tara:strand:- start:2 stop:973 length:972 start_codon:yes stop_codon:yes gene_type:complete
MNTAMAQTDMQYTLEDINKVKLKGFDIDLPESTLTMINKLATLVGSPEYVRTPVFKKRSGAQHDLPRRGEKLGEINTGVTDEDWEALKNYKVTETVPKDRTEDDQLKRDIITALRKMTNTNYDSQSKLVFDHLSNVKSENMAEVALEMFKICTGNKFYVDVYVKLYNALCETNTAYDAAVFSSILNTHSENYLAEFSKIRTVDPNKDYDLFCEVNKENESRIALSVFLMKFLDRDYAETLISSLLVNVYDEIKKKDNINVVEQYAENISEMITAILDKYNGISNESITASVGNIAMLQFRNFPSLTNKIVFKFMDMEEAIENS